MSKNHLISVILPVYNGEDFLEESIKSVLNQTFTNFELIVVDDASTDKSLSIAQQFRIIDNRVKIISNKENLLLPGSLNVGHQSSKGKYVTWTSDDNRMKENFLEKLYETIINRDCDLVYSNYDVIWTNGKLKRINQTGSVTGLIFGNSIGASFLYKKEVFEELSGYREDMYLVEDYHFFLTASLKFEFYHLEESLYQYRIHPFSLSAKIDSDEEYASRFNDALRKVYVEIGQSLQFSEISVEFLLDLFFRRNYSLEAYLKNRQIVERDLIKFEDNLVLPDENILFVLRSRIRESWILDQRKLSLRNLLHVLVYNRSLLTNAGDNPRKTLSIIRNCFK